jgi:hypothetical protein
VNGRREKMTAPEKRALSARGQLCRPVGWTRDERRRSLRFRRQDRARPSGVEELHGSAWGQLREFLQDPRGFKVADIARGEPRKGPRW